MPDRPERNKYVEAGPCMFLKEPVPMRTAVRSDPGDFTNEADALAYFETMQREHPDEYVMLKPSDYGDLYQVKHRADLPVGST